MRAGINLRNIALSSDGRYVAAANYLPHSLVILDAADLKPLKVIPATDRAGKATSRVSAVYDARPRGSFIVALKDIPELWEVAYRDDAKPIYRGFVHSYEAGMVEGVAEPGKFGARRIALDQPLDDFFFDPDYRHLLGSGRDAGKAVVVNLDVGRPIATIDMPGLPHLGSGITWNWQGRTVMATPNLKEGAVSIIDMQDWRVIKRIETAGPGFFLRSHENTPYAWADVFFGPNKDVMHVIDKSTLEVVATLRPEPGRTLAHAEFTRDGRFVLVSLWEMDGAVIVYDASDARGGQAPAHGQAFRKIQRFQQDNSVGRNQSLKRGGWRAAPLQSYLGVSLRCNRHRSRSPARKCCGPRRKRGRRPSRRYPRVCRTRRASVGR